MFIKNKSVMTHAYRMLLSFQTSVTKELITYQFSYPLRHNDANHMIPHPLLLRHFQIFIKIDSFPKIFLKLFRIKKTNDIFEGLSNLYLIVLLISFLPPLLWITAENRTKLKKLLFWATKSSGTQHQRDWTWFLQYFWLQ